MDANKQRKQAAPARKLLGVLVFLALAYLIYYVAYCYGRPEKVWEEAGTDYGGISGGLVQTIWRNGQKYWLTDDDVQGSKIYARPIIGGHERLIVQEDPKLQIPYGSMTVSDKGVVYGVIKRPKPFGNGAGGGWINQIVWEGTFRAAPGKPPAASSPPEKRQHFLSKAQQRRMRLRRVPLEGGNARDLAEIASPGNPCIVGENAYWIRQGRYESIYVTRGKKAHREVVPHGDLMVTPLNGGPTRRLYSGISESLLFAGTDGVFWTEPHVYPDRTVDLYHMHATDTKPVAFAAFENTGLTNLSGLTEYGGRMYWLLYGITGGQAVTYAGNDTRLMSARLDGTDQRVIPFTSMAPQICGNRLYIIAADPQSAQNKTPSVFLWQIHPEKNDAMEKIRPLTVSGGYHVSVDFHFDGDYLYISTSESTRGLWASLMDDNTAPPIHVSRLFRVPLHQ